MYSPKMKKPKKENRCQVKWCIKQSISCEELGTRTAKRQQISGKESDEKRVIQKYNLKIDIALVVQHGF